MSGPLGGIAPRVLIVVRDGAVAGSLQAVLVAQAEDWARQIGAASVDRVRGVAAADPGGAFSGQALQVRAKRGPGPLLVVWPEIAQLRPLHAAGALTDLRDGADAVIGPIFSGGFYLVAVDVIPERLLTLPSRFWSDPNALGLAIPQPGDPPFELGLLRAERGLSTPTDIAAALVDPVTPVAVGRELRAR